MGMCCFWWLLEVLHRLVFPVTWVHGLESVATSPCGAGGSSIQYFDYCLNPVTMLCRRIWMSFFDTEELHAVMPDKVADRGGLPWRDDTGI